MTCESLSEHQRGAGVRSQEQEHSLSTQRGDTGIPSSVLASASTLALYGTLLINFCGREGIVATSGCERFKMSWVSSPLVTEKVLCFPMSEHWKSLTSAKAQS